MDVSVYEDLSLCWRQRLAYVRFPSDPAHRAVDRGSGATIHRTAGRAVTDSTEAVVKASRCIETVATTRRSRRQAAQSSYRTRRPSHSASRYPATADSSRSGWISEITVPKEIPTRSSRITCVAFSSRLFLCERAARGRPTTRKE